MRKIFVTGNGTDVGKTVISAILVEALKADYWKPIQAGGLDNTDTMFVKSLVSNDKSVFHPEQFVLTEPMSPHAAARIDNVEIKLNDFKTPQAEGTLIIEGAGGLMVPINDENNLIIDLIQHFDTEAVIVSRNYLGSINHTLLTFEVLKQRGVTITGIIFNGEENKETESYILKFTGVPLLGRVNLEESVDKEMIRKYAIQFEQI
ncbi:MAG: dethiobiotin synthase [Flavobacteriales bacterium]|nr:dethiobiotin synthase [Flavobacteriales bacterium]